MRNHGSTVAILPVQDTVQETVRQVMELASWRTYLAQGKPTALKVNLGWDLFLPGSITSPWVLEGVIQTVKDYVGPLYLVESDQVLENIEKAFRKARLQELCDRYGVRWINLSNTEYVSVPVQNGKVFTHLEVPRILTETQMITIPVMKTHAKTQITGAIKNQWGCISKLRHNYHLVLTDALADINSVIRPVFAVMDATIALEGNGPKSGRPKVVDRVLASNDIVALDTIQAKLMGLDPGTIAHVQACSQRGLGTSSLTEIEIVGEKELPAFDFIPARHNLVSRLEESLRRSSLKKLVFDTPVFLLMLFGAKLWYLFWLYLFGGNKHWDIALHHPVYGPEWQHLREKL